jgi:hypothetical protein
LGLGFGIYALVSNSDIKELLDDHDNLERGPEENSKTAEIVLTTVSALVVLLSFLGCCGAFKVIQKQDTLAGIWLLYAIDIIYFIDLKELSETFFLCIIRIVLCTYIKRFKFGASGKPVCHLRLLSYSALHNSGSAHWRHFGRLDLH